MCWVGCMVCCSSSRHLQRLRDGGQGVDVLVRERYCTLRYAALRCVMLPQQPALPSILRSPAVLRKITSLEEFFSRVTLADFQFQFTLMWITSKANLLRSFINQISVELMVFCLLRKSKECRWQEVEIEWFDSWYRIPPFLIADYGNRFRSGFHCWKQGGFKFRKEWSKSYTIVEFLAVTRMPSCGTATSKYHRMRRRSQLQ